MHNLSIIVTCQEQQHELQRLLPQLLSLQYGGEYEVIVVDKAHDKDMIEWLEDMELRYSGLSHTFCPATSRGIDIHKLALTLGAKAAAYEWLAVLPAETQLQGEDWLRNLMACCDDEADVAVGITDRKRKLNWFSSYIFRRRFSLYRPTSAVILCRRSVLLQSKPVKLSKRQVIKL